MERGRENSAIVCRFLGENDFAELHKTFLEAFSDYAVPFQLSPEQLQRHILVNAVALDRSVGCFAPGEADEKEEKMVGFTLNGFGEWNGRPTLYDAGTGVIPQFRRLGASRAMFEFMLPVFYRRGFRQCLLEVISSNEKAVNLYRALGFQETRKLLVLKTAQPLKISRQFRTDLKIEKISQPDWNHLQTFWDVKPAWQNSCEACDRTRDIRNIIGAFKEDECLGYIIFSGDSGNLNQIAVEKNNRNQGIGSLLLSQMQSAAKKEHPLQVINLDESLTKNCRFFHNRGFTETLNQYEMIKTF